MNSLVGDRLFSKENMEERGRLYSPREAIRDLRDCVRKFKRSRDIDEKQNLDFYSGIFDKGSSSGSKFGLGGGKFD